MGFGVSTCRGYAAAAGKGHTPGNTCVVWGGEVLGDACGTCGGMMLLLLLMLLLLMRVVAVEE